MFTGTGTLPNYATGCVPPLLSFREYLLSLKVGGCGIHFRDIPGTTHIFLPLLHMALIQTDFQVPSDWTAGRIWVC